MPTTLVKYIKILDNKQEKKILGRPRGSLFLYMNFLYLTVNNSILEIYALLGQSQSVKVRESPISDRH